MSKPGLPNFDQAVLKSAFPGCLSTHACLASRCSSVSHLYCILLLAGTGDSENSKKVAREVESLLPRAGVGAGGLQATFHPSELNSLTSTKMYFGVEVGSKPEEQLGLELVDTFAVAGTTSRGVIVHRLQMAKVQPVESEGDGLLAIKDSEFSGLEGGVASAGELAIVDKDLGELLCSAPIVCAWWHCCGSQLCDMTTLKCSCHHRAHVALS